MTQTESILEALQHGDRLTPIDALERFRCFRLAARIDDLRRAGYMIQTHMHQHGRKKWAEYRLWKPDA